MKRDGICTAIGNNQCLITIRNKKQHPCQFGDLGEIE